MLCTSMFDLGSMLGRIRTVPYRLRLSVCGFKVDGAAGFPGTAVAVFPTICILSSSSKELIAHLPLELAHTLQRITSISPFAPAGVAGRQNMRNLPLFVGCDQMNVASCLQASSGHILEMESTEGYFYVSYQVWLA